MTKRTKSVADLRRQMLRIDANASGERANKAWKIYERYRNNIQSRKSWQREYDRALSMENSNYDEARNIVRKANSKKYSQSTYMGINAG